MDELIQNLWQDLLDKDDRTSPAEYPDMALIAFEEFAACIKLVVTEQRARELTEREIDAGAQALRQLEQRGRLLHNWADLSDADRREWHEKATVVLRAARS